MYRVALAVTLVLVVAALFALGRPATPKLSNVPVSFDGSLAAGNLRVITTQFSTRVAGSDADNRAGIWVLDQFEQLGLETHVEGFTAEIEGREVALQNVWGVAPGTAEGAILLVANRDTLPGATQGANDNGSGLAALVELARASTVSAHDHTLIFLATTGDAFGALGSRQFAESYGRGDDLIAVIALKEVATRERQGMTVDGWSTSPKTSPPWLWLLTGPAARVHLGEEALLPGPAAQIIRLAAPTTPGSQGPFVGNGVPGITVRAAGAKVAPQNDIIDNVSTETLARSGAAVQAMVLAIDAGPLPPERSGGSTFLTRQRTLPGGALLLMILAALLPLLAVTVDLFAHCRRERVRLRAAFLRGVLHLMPWLTVVAVVYLANMTGILPRSPGAIIPPESPIVDEPQYLRVVLLLAALVLVYVYAVAIERRLERRVAIDARAVVFAAHSVLVLIVAIALLVNPYSVLVFLPAALFWPLARAGSWQRSLLPAYFGLVMIPVVLIYYAAYSSLGWKVWWYFLLLVETRAIPPIVVLLGVLFLSTAGLLAHTLYERSDGAEELEWHSEPRTRIHARTVIPVAGDAATAGRRRRWGTRHRRTIRS